VRSGEPVRREASLVGLRVRYSSATAGWAERSRDGFRDKEGGAPSRSAAACLREHIIRSAWKGASWAHVCRVMQAVRIEVMAWVIRRDHADPWVIVRAKVYRRRPEVSPARREARTLCPPAA
jgi:hypothetical protein